MHIEKKKLADIKRCYCVSNLSIQGENHIVFASEDPNVGCFKFSGEHFEKKDTIWETPGGCMSIVPIPGKEKEFLAVQEFYLKISPSLAKIVWCKQTEKGWITKDILHLPYIHRFDIYRKNGVNYFIGATIASKKEHKEDWRVPGKIYVAEIPEDASQGFEIDVLGDGFYRNHGYYKDTIENCGYFSSDQGIVKISPPKRRGGQWCMELILQGAIGEIATYDLDGDGEQEIMTIEPFHGNKIKIYKKIDRVYEVVYEYENEIDFAHTLVAGTLRGIPSFIAGVRRKEAELFYVQYQEGTYVTSVIEKGVGPANLCLVNEKDRDLIISANHTVNEATVYIVTK